MSMSVIHKYIVKGYIHFNTLCTNVEVVIIVMFMNCNQITCANMIKKITVKPLAVCTVHALFVVVRNSR